MAQVDQLASNARLDPVLREQFIADYAGFILSCASKATSGPVHKSDDEWSIALIAFNQAIDSYDSSKGSFLSHARLVITRRLIDYRRAQHRRKEIPVPPEAFRDEESETLTFEVVSIEDEAPDPALREELLSANQVLLDYGFSFFDLAGRTPRKKRPRCECADAVNELIDTPPLFKWMREKRRLPLSKLSKVTGARQKTLSLFRYFIIAGAEILKRNFPTLKRYFSFIRGEVRR